MRARDLQEGPLDKIKKQADKVKKQADKVGSKFVNKSGPKTTPKTDPTNWDNEDGSLRTGVRVSLKGTEYEWTGRAWKNTKTGATQPTNTAAHSEMMKQVGRKPNGEKLPEYPNIIAKAKAWWDGKHGEFGIASRKKSSPFVKAMGLAGAGIDAAIRGASRNSTAADPDAKHVGDLNIPDDRADRLKKAVDRSAPLEESGSVEGVGLIHLSEIEPTIAYLENKLGMEIATNTLGSVGKKTWSGDIDVAVNAEEYPIPELIEKLNNTAGVEKVKRLAGNTVTSRVKIQQYDDTIENDDGRPRTGYVQVDFMIGDPTWLKTYNWSPAQGESRYKGAIRTIMLGTLAGYYDRQESDERLPDGRPLVTERYKLGGNGLIRVRRTPKPKANGNGYTKANIDEVIGGPWRDPAEVASKLNLGDESALNSFETLLKAIENRYDPQVVEQIKEEMRQNATVQQIGMPEELK